MFANLPVEKCLDFIYQKEFLQVFAKSLAKLRIIYYIIYMGKLLFYRIIDFLFDLMIQNCLGGFTNEEIK